MLADASELLTTIKKAALDAVESKKPVNVFFGTVISVNPLKIDVEQKMILEKEQLVLARNVTDFKSLVTVQWETEKEETTHTHKVQGSDSEGESIDLTSGTQSKKHIHDVVGQKEMTFHFGLEQNDEVILIRQQGGQKYIVIDRIGGV